MKLADLHADIAFDLLEHKEDKKRFETEHLPKLKTGEVAYCSIANYFDGSQTLEQMKEMMDHALEMIENSDVELLKTAEDFRTKTGVFMTVEGMCGVKDNPEQWVQFMKDHHVLIASLCWNEANALAKGAKGAADYGLTDLGREVIAMMEEKNILLDVSHASDDAFYDMMKVATKPVFATHSNARALCNAPRNLKDDQIDMIGKTGGLIGMNGFVNFISTEKEKQDAEHLAQHARYIADRIGVEHVALGFDFMDYFSDGDGKMAKGLESAAHAQNMVEALRHYFTEKEVELICYQNVVNFFANYL